MEVYIRTYESADIVHAICTYCCKTKILYICWLYLWFSVSVWSQCCFMLHVVLHSKIVGSIGIDVRYVTILISHTLDSVSQPSVTSRKY